MRAGGGPYSAVGGHPPTASRSRLPDSCLQMTEYGVVGAGTPSALQLGNRPKPAAGRRPAECRRCCRRVLRAPTRRSPATGFGRTGGAQALAAFKGVTINQLGVEDKGRLDWVDCNRLGPGYDDGLGSGDIYRLGFGSGRCSRCAGGDYFEWFDGIRFDSFLDCRFYLKEIAQLGHCKGSCLGWA